MVADLWNTLATLSLWQIQGCFRALEEDYRFSPQISSSQLCWEKTRNETNQIKYLLCTNPLGRVHCKHLVDQVLCLQEYIIIKVEAELFEYIIKVEAELLSWMEK